MLARLCVFSLTAAAAMAAAAAPARAQSCRTAEAESNDGQSLANAGVCSGQSVQGTMSRRRDVDWYSFSVGGPGTISISLSHGAGVDFDWYLYQATGSSVARGTTTANPETGSFAAPAAGTYYLEVVSYAGTGSYAITASFPAGGGGGGGTCDDGPRPSKPSNLTAAIVGDAADACVTPTEPGLLLMGGGSDVDAAFSQRIKPRLAGGDIVVLRTSGADGYNSYFAGLMAPNSVETLIVDTVTKANSAYVAWVVRTAEFVWFAGGDQSDYLNQWRGTALEAAVKHVRDTGGLIGGTSAGLAILGDVIYDPDGVSGVTSAQAVLNPCGASMLFSENFLDLPLMEGIITDTHFRERDRMGRLLSFMARVGTSTLTPYRKPITAIAVDEATSMFIDDAGRGVVDGAGSVYVLREDASTVRTTVACGSPIVYSGVLRTKLGAGGTFDLATGQGSATPTRIGIDGRLGTFYVPASPY